MHCSLSCFAVLPLKTKIIETNKKIKFYNVKKYVTIEVMRTG